VCEALKIKTGLTTRNVALVAIFGALYYVVSLITVNISAAGVPAVQISLAALIASVFGLVLGPYLGTLAAFLGAFVAWTLPPSGMAPTGLPFLLSPPLNALVTGLIFYKKWKAGFLAFSLLIIAFLFTPPVQPLTENSIVAIAVLFDKIIALLLILPVVKFTKQFSSSEKGVYAFYFLIGFIGNQADNMWGSFVFATPMVYGSPFFGGLPVDAVRGLFLVSPFLYTAIRLIQASIVMIIAVPLLHSLKETPWVWKKETILSPYQKEQKEAKN
jgi:hypothetical protein